MIYTFQLGILLLVQQLASQMAHKFSQEEGGLLLSYALGKQLTSQELSLVEDMFLQLDRMP